MPEFRYRAKLPNGESAEGTVTERNWQEACKWLIGRYGAILSLEEVRKTGPRWTFRGRVPAMALTLFLRQLETMLTSGIPMHRALNCLSETGDSPELNRRLDLMCRRVESGSSLSQAMGDHPDLFSGLQLALVRTGEEAGRLEACLGRLAVVAERMTRLRQRVISTLTYPCVLAIVCLALIGLFVLYLVPRMQSIFLTLGGEPPFITRLLLAIVNVASHPIVWVGALLTIVVLMVAFPILYKRRAIRRTVDLCLLHIPLVGDLVMKNALAQLLYAWSTLMESGVPLAGQMVVLRDASGNTLVSESFARTRMHIDQGEEIHRALQMEGLFPGMMVQMVQVGEESGELDRMMSRLAVMYEDDVVTSLDNLASLLEPLILGVMGTAVGFVAVATALPIIKLSTSL